MKAAQPELRTEKLARYESEYGLPQYDAEILTGSKHLADVFEQTVAICGKPKEVSNWLMTEAMRLLKEQEHGAGRHEVFSGESGKAHQPGREERY